MAEQALEDLAEVLAGRQRELNAELGRMLAGGEELAGTVEARMARLSVVGDALEQLVGGASAQEFGEYLDRMGRLLVQGRGRGKKTALDELGDIKGEFGARFSPGLQEEAPVAV